MILDGIKNYSKIHNELLNVAIFLYNFVSCKLRDDGRMKIDDELRVNPQRIEWLWADNIYWLFI